jgi:hypothetical protein
MLLSTSTEQSNPTRAADVMTVARSAFTFVLAALDDFRIVKSEQRKEEFEADAELRTVRLRQRKSGLTIKTFIP